MNNDNYGENLDKEDTVVYKANPVVPGPDDPNPKPDPDPTPDPDPELEDFVPPLPEEEPGAEYPD